ncbi:RP-L18Ae [Acanthosepion pharaonis]|uniref:60S ribosomal protein L18a n=1 Tax=Acanthosepion pharaonis TaxID=158019 RepID=A0A812E1U9_ACAPH|nr:RP-L18Ae [Sepia pharaonis]
MRARGELKQYKVIGRELPTEKCPKPPLFQMRIFASEPCSAKSRFWYFASQLRKLKKTRGEIVCCHRIFERKPGTIKNYGIWLRYQSRSGIHNMYKEYRDLSAAGAVTQCYRDMGARHRARPSSIQIIRVETVAAKKCRRAYIKQFHDAKIKFPLPHRVNKNLHNPRFTTRRPYTNF